MSEKKLICSLDVVEELLMTCCRVPELGNKAAGCRVLLLGGFEAIDVDAVLDITDALQELSYGALCGHKLVLGLLSFLDFPAGLYAFLVEPVHCFDSFLVTVQQESVKICGMNDNLSAFNVHCRPPNGVASPSE